MPIPPRPNSYEHALELYDSTAYLEAADVASAGYVSPGVPTVRRLQSAHLAQEALSRAYETATTPRPEYLCRALDVLEATAILAVEDDDIRLHQTLTDAHRTKLVRLHPTHVCEVGTELRPVRTHPRRIILWRGEVTRPRAAR